MRTEVLSHTWVRIRWRTTKFNTAISGKYIGDKEDVTDT
jgi:hypothetical protein